MPYFILCWGESAEGPNFFYFQRVEKYIKSPHIPIEILRPFVDSPLLLQFLTDFYFFSRGILGENKMILVYMRVSTGNRNDYTTLYIIIDTFVTLTLPNI